MLKKLLISSIGTMGNIYFFVRCNVEIVIALIRCVLLDDDGNVKSFSIPTAKLRPYSILDIIFIWKNILWIMLLIYVVFPSRERSLGNNVIIHNHNVIRCARWFQRGINRFRKCFHSGNLNVISLPETSGYRWFV